MSVGSRLLRLPPELRDAVYHFVALDDRLAFADHIRRPPLLRTCKQLRQEYASIFFAHEFVVFDAYYPETDWWSLVGGKSAKMDLFGRARFIDMAGFCNSLAGAQRHCQKYCNPLTEEEVTTGGRGAC
ncbi:hypothetical protein M409DRAFT_48777 [Zasmidium cellare ATCC 36951]|uniref:F-box domain-containing protein n=1 Tax=Zasmidium cellare ATCC 36951 TaxID=1080233 RepID=A0A6A6D6L4_ZASCE|nr:uncharacterized protein M409DRAFT_48777 [Zasmidium cellare ATCC 36951]KAF2173862.1 hypothetical protein M409DRAFT_48777 [Zasmidium cellare ATCC 36951]